jgi:hypothetical protein
MTLAHSLGVEVTAEGVEIPEQVEYLRNEGVHQLQGYLLGKPRAPENLDVRISRAAILATVAGSVSHLLIKRNRLIGFCVSESVGFWPLRLRNKR